MKETSSNDPFSQSSQVNARLDGKYHEIAANTGKCVFCDLKDKYILHEKDGLVATVNIFPYIDGQVMILPRRHIEKYNELTDQEVLTNFYLSKIVMASLEKELGIEGFWLILREGEIGKKSGKTVSHLHWNIMPYSNDLNTWHYQEITVPPINLAEKLRPYFNDART